MTKKNNLSDNNLDSIQDKKYSSCLNDIIKKISKQSEGSAYVNIGSKVDGVSDFISTGNDILDIVVSNSINGGVPLGRITELSGLESSGKSLLAASLCANVQKKGGFAIYIDSEESIHPKFFSMLGVDLDKLIIINEKIIEKVYTYIETIIYEIRSNYDSISPILIVFDSITAASAEAEEDTKYSLEGYQTQKSKINSKSLKFLASLVARNNTALVITSQLRTKIGAMAFADPYIESSGGFALQFYATLRLRLTKANKIYKTIDGLKETIGKNIKLVVHKSKLGTEFNTMTFNILYSSGIQNYSSWIDILKKYKIITGGAGGNYKLNLIDPETGEIKEIKFKSSEFVKMMKQDVELKNKILSAIGDKLIVKYETTSDENIDDKYDIEILKDGEEIDVLENVRNTFNSNNTDNTSDIDVSTILKDDDDIDND